MPVLPIRPVQSAGQSFWDLVVRARLANSAERTGAFVRSTLGLAGPKRGRQVDVDVRLPSEELITRFTQAMWDPDMDLSQDDLKNSFRDSTLWPIVDLVCHGNHPAPEEAGRLLKDPFIASSGAFCPQCLADDIFRYRRTAWQVGVVTLCLHHKVLLADHAACGASPGGMNLGERLFHPATSHPPSPLCPGCSLAKTPTLSLSEDGTGLVAQEVLQTKLGLRDGSISAEAEDTLREGLFTLPRDRFWHALYAALAIASRVASLDPKLVHNPLGRELGIRPSFCLGTHPAVPDRYAMHCLVCTAVGWMRNPSSFAQPVRALAMPRYRSLGRLDLPDLLIPILARSAEVTQLTRLTLSGICHDWVSLRQIIERRALEDFSEERFDMEARRVGVTAVKLNGIDEGRGERLWVDPEDAIRLTNMSLPDGTIKDEGLEPTSKAHRSRAEHEGRRTDEIHSEAMASGRPYQQDLDASEGCQYPACRRPRDYQYGKYCIPHGMELVGSYPTSYGFHLYSQLEAVATKARRLDGSRLL